MKKIIIATSITCSLIIGLVIGTTLNQTEAELPLSDKIENAVNEEMSFGSLIVDSGEVIKIKEIIEKDVIVNAFFIEYTIFQSTLGQEKITIVYKRGFEENGVFTPIEATETLELDSNKYFEYFSKMPICEINIGGNLKKYLYDIVQEKLQITGEVTVAE